MYATVGEQIYLEPIVENDQVLDYNLEISNQKIGTKDTLKPATRPSRLSTLVIGEAGTKEITYTFTRQGATSPVATITIKFTTSPPSTQKAFNMIILEPPGKKLQTATNNFAIDLDMHNPYALIVNTDPKGKIKDYTVKWESTIPREDSFQEGRIGNLPAVEYTPKTRGTRTITARFFKAAKEVESLTVTINAKPNLTKIEKRMEAAWKDFEPWGRTKSYVNKKPGKSPPWNIFSGFLKTEKNISAQTEGLGETKEDRSKFLDISSKVWKNNARQ